MQWIQWQLYDPCRFILLQLREKQNKLGEQTHSLIMKYTVNSQVLGF